MKWILDRQINSSNHWHLEGAESLIGLRYNRQSRSLRLSARERRLYFLEKTGFFQSRLRISTEYSVTAGECHFTKNKLAGTLQVDNEKFDFSATENQLSLFGIDHSLEETVTIDGLDKMDKLEFGALVFALAKLPHER